MLSLKEFLKKHEKNIYTTACIALFLFSTLTIVRSVYWHHKLISYPYQQEYREGGALIATELYLNHQNPFSIEQQPHNTYTYGFLYPLAVTPFARLYGNTLLVHRSFIYFFIAATCLLLLYVLICMKVNFFFAFAASVILHQSLINAINTSIARPEGLGIFLYTLAIIITWRLNYSRISLGMSIILGLLGYFTKAYYIFVIPVIALYLFFFISKRKSVIYILVSAVSFVLLNALVSAIYPVYNNNTIFSQANISNYLFSHMKNQLIEYTGVYIFLLMIAFSSCIILFIKFIHNHWSETIAEVITKIRSRIRVNSVYKILKNQPFISLNKNFDLFFLFVFVSVVILFLVKLGGHTGNFNAAYLYHLASFFLIAITFQVLNLTSSNIFKSIAALLLILTMNLEFDAVKNDFKESISCFKQVEEVIKKSKNTLNSPESVSIMIQENKPVYNSGLTEFFAHGVSKFSLFTGSSKGVSEQAQKFRKEVNEKISGKEFDLIMLTKSYYSYFVNKDVLNQFYRQSGTLCAPMNYQNWTIETWIPK